MILIDDYILTITLYAYIRVIYLNCICYVRLIIIVILCIESARIQNNYNQEKKFEKYVVSFNFFIITNCKHLYNIIRVLRI